MYALTDDLARRRILYRRPLATLPDILVVDVPRRFADPSLPLGRFYPILIETEAERDEIESFLSMTRAAPVAPNILDHRPSRLTAHRITFASYAPPGPAWPFLLLCHWPAAYASLVTDPMMFARDAYTTEMFRTEAALASASRRLMSALGRMGEVSVSMIPPLAVQQGHA